LVAHGGGESHAGYYYENLETKEMGFGFNVVDGGGFLPEGDLVEDSVVKEAIIEGV